MSDAPHETKNGVPHHGGSADGDAIHASNGDVEVGCDVSSAAAAAFISDPTEMNWVELVLKMKMGKRDQQKQKRRSRSSGSSKGGKSGSKSSSSSSSKKGRSSKSKGNKQSSGSTRSKVKIAEEQLLAYHRQRSSLSCPEKESFEGEEETFHEQRVEEALNCLGSRYGNDNITSCSEEQEVSSMRHGSPRCAIGFHDEDIELATAPKEFRDSGITDSTVSTTAESTDWDTIDFYPVDTTTSRKNTQHHIISELSSSYRTNKEAEDAEEEGSIYHVFKSNIMLVNYKRSSSSTKYLILFTLFLIIGGIVCFMVGQSRDNLASLDDDEVTSWKERDKMIATGDHKGHDAGTGSSSSKLFRPPREYHDTDPSDDILQDTHNINHSASSSSGTAGIANDEKSKEEDDYPQVNKTSSTKTIQIQPSSFITTDQSEFQDHLSALASGNNVVGTTSFLTFEFDGESPIALSTTDGKEEVVRVVLCLRVLSDSVDPDADIAVDAYPYHKEHDDGSVSGGGDTKSGLDRLISGMNALSMLLNKSKIVFILAKLSTSFFDLL